MDLVLINPALFKPEEYKERFDRFLSWVKRGNMYVYPYEPPLGLASIAAVLKEKGYKVELIDQQGLHIGQEELVKMIVKLQPKIIGLTAMTSTFPVARKLGEILKKELPNSLIIAGGVHPTVCPEDTLMGSYFDVIFRGEAEATLPQFMATFPDGGWQNTPGIGYKANNKVVLTNMPTLIKDLNNLPQLDYTSFPLDNYVEYNKSLRGIKGISMLVSRGCPYQCSFCAVKATMGRGWRCRSPEAIVEEIKFLHDNYGIEGIWFKDSILNMDKKWFQQFCNKLLEAELPISWQFNTRVDLLDAESLTLAKKAGLVQVDLGIESGSARTLARLKKKTTVQDIISGVSLAKKFVKVSGFFMIGCPGETMEDIEMTFDLAKSLELDSCSWSIYNPLPGSELYEEYIMENPKLASEVEKTHFSHVDTSVCQIPVEILNAKYKEINSYFADIKE